MAFTTVVTLVGLGLSVPSAAGAPTAIRWGAITLRVPAARTDPSITGPGTANLAIPAVRSQANGYLAVFLPGTEGEPACCQDFLDTAAALGFAVVRLQYSDGNAVRATCLDNRTCFGKVRQNIFDGRDRSTSSDLPPVDGISHRLTSLLLYLQRHHPSQHWVRFLVNGRPRWGSIVLTGHSQGGGEATFIGTEVGLRGEVDLSSPADTDLRDRPATWLDRVAAGPTPLRRIVGFVHTGDQYGDRILSDWRAMGLTRPRSPVIVDDRPTPYGCAHELISSAPLPDLAGSTPGAVAHASTAEDDATPLRQDGSPLYTPVWRYLLQTAAGIPRSPGVETCR